MVYTNAEQTNLLTGVVLLYVVVFFLAGIKLQRVKLAWYNKPFLDRHNTHFRDAPIFRRQTKQGLSVS